RNHRVARARFPRTRRCHRHLRARLHCLQNHRPRFGAQTIEAPSRDYGHDLDAMLNAITDRTELIFIANPNNPTGTLLSADAIERFMARLPPQVLVVFDEAYYEFVDEMPDTLRYMRNGRNVVTL